MPRLMQPLIRAATLDGYLPLATSVGLDPESLITRVGLELPDLQAPERWVPAAAAANLLELSATLSGRPDFGVRLGAERRLATLGPISVAVREEPDLRRVLRVLIRHEQSYNEALRLRFEENGDTATVRLWLELGEPVPVTQATALGMAALSGVIREAVGAQWHPLAACFTFPPPLDARAYADMFGPGARFEEPFTGLVLRSRDLDATNALSDPLLRPYAQQFLDAAVARGGPSVTARVSELVELLLPIGTCSMTNVARAMQVDPRTLRRHLAHDETTFSTIVDGVRSGLAQRYLSAGHHTMTEISQLLGFEAPSAFSRWFTHRFGMTPREWRRSTQSSTT
jgi:AraC-like DNA-binding protein